MLTVSGFRRRTRKIWSAVISLINAFHVSRTLFGLGTVGTDRPVAVWSVTQTTVGLVTQNNRQYKNQVLSAVVSTGRHNTRQLTSVTACYQHYRASVFEREFLGLSSNQHYGYQVNSNAQLNVKGSYAFLHKVIIIHQFYAKPYNNW